MGIGPVPATRKALERAGLSFSDLGLIELNNNKKTQYTQTRGKAQPQVAKKKNNNNI
ncbi:hypothetical protein MHTCC0001_36950 [Flavobacteriaceae bacterium MHTCC 0001]